MAVRLSGLPNKLPTCRGLGEGEQVFGSVGELQHLHPAPAVPVNPATFVRGCAKINVRDWQD